jgi:hypothetical protein
MFGIHQLIPAVILLLGVFAAPVAASPLRQDAATCPIHPTGNALAYQAAQLLEDETAIRACAAIGDKSILEGIARNWRTPPDVLAVLATHPHHHVRGAVASNPQAPRELLRGFMQDPHAWVRVDLATNPALPDDVLHTLVAIAMQSNTIPADERAYIAQGVAKNPRTPEPNLRWLATHRLLVVRQHVGMNVAAPDDLLRQLLADPEPVVRAHAQTNLRNRGAAVGPPASPPAVLAPAPSARHPEWLVSAAGWLRFYDQQRGTRLSWALDQMTLTSENLNPGAWGAFRGGRGQIILNAATAGESPHAIAAVLAHESKHALDFLTVGPPGGSFDCYASEIAAFAVQADVWASFYGLEGKPHPKTALEKDLNLVLFLARTAPHRLIEDLTALYHDQCG